MTTRTRFSYFIFHIFVALFLLTPCLALADLSVAISNATKITATTARLNAGVLDVAGTNPVCIFYWGITNAGTNTGSWGATTNLGTQVVGKVSADVTGLSAATIYYYRLLATNAASDWTSVGSFETLAASHSWTSSAVIVGTNGVILYPSNFSEANGLAGTGTVSNITARVAAIEGRTNLYETSYGWGDHSTNGYGSTNAEYVISQLVVKAQSTADLARVEAAAADAKAVAASNHNAYADSAGTASYSTNAGTAAALGVLSQNVQFFGHSPAIMRGIEGSTSSNALHASGAPTSGTVDPDNGASTVWYAIGNATYPGWIIDYLSTGASWMLIDNAIGNWGLYYSNQAFCARNLSTPGSLTVSGGINGTATNASALNGRAESDISNAVYSAAVTASSNSAASIYCTSATATIHSNLVVNAQATGDLALAEARTAQATGNQAYAWGAVAVTTPSPGTAGAFLKWTGDRVAADSSAYEFGTGNKAWGSSGPPTDLGSDNVAIGDHAMQLSAGGTVEANVAIGGSSMLYDPAPAGNTAVGYEAAAFSTSKQSTCVGYMAGKNQSGVSNIYIGASSGCGEDQATYTDQTNVIVVGVGAVSKGSGTAVWGRGDQVNYFDGPTVHSNNVTVTGIISNPVTETFGASFIVTNVASWSRILYGPFPFTITCTSLDCMQGGSSAVVSVVSLTNGASVSDAGTTMNSITAVGATNNTDTEWDSATLTAGERIKISVDGAASDYLSATNDVHVTVRYTKPRL